MNVCVWICEGEWKQNSLEEEPGDWVHKQFWNGKSQNLSDFLQTIGYATKNVDPKHNFGQIVTVSRQLCERVYLRTCDLSFLCKNGCFFLF